MTSDVIRQVENREPNDFSLALWLRVDLIAGKIRKMGEKGKGFGAR
jgi:hypothetical protein